METKTNLGNEPITKLGNEPQVSMEGNEAVEFAKGITSEQMKAEFFNNAQLREPNYQLYQLNSRGKRYYYIFNGDEPEFFPSVTTILHNVMPENRVLTDWKVSLGKERAEAYTMERANYGTFLHGQIANMLIAGEYDLDKMREELGKYAERKNLPSSFVEAYENDAKEDMIAFAKWAVDYDVKPLAIEVSMYSPKYGYAGTIDLVCNMREFSKEDTRKMATDNRINAIVDFKSSRKGFHDDYALQLEMYRRMWMEHYPDVPIERIFNLEPKEWSATVKKVPSYNFKEQTDNEQIQCLEEYLSIFNKQFNEDRKFTVCSGVINLKEDVSSRVEVYDMVELVKSHKREEVVEEEEEKSLFD